MGIERRSICVLGGIFFLGVCEMEKLRNQKSCDENKDSDETGPAMKAMAGTIASTFHSDTQFLPGKGIRKAAEAALC
ncbi:MAG: hypothetical protein AB7D92_05385 [Sphaerochaeta sp.]